MVEVCGEVVEVRGEVDKLCGKVVEVCDEVVEIWDNPKWDFLVEPLWNNFKSSYILNYAFNLKVKDIVYLIEFDGRS